MAGQTNHVLNPTSAAIIGINDELMALYQNIKSIYDEVAEELEATHPNRTIWPDTVEIAAYGKVKKAIDNLLPRITPAFTDEYASLHPNELAMKAFNFFNVKHTKPLTLQISYISYVDFLREMQDFVVRVILQRKRYTLPKIPYERVECNVIRHINAILEKTQENKVITDDSRAPEVLKGMIIVFENLSAISCNLNNHIVESVAVPVPLLTSSALIMLPIHHCITCGRYFIGSETLKIYERLYGRLFIRTVREGADPSELAFFGESELHRTGYNVRKDGMTKIERQAFLSKLISDKVMCKFDICRDIEKAIKIFDGRTEYADAVAKWKDDLLYVSNKFIEK